DTGSPSNHSPKPDNASRQPITRCGHPIFVSVNPAAVLAAVEAGKWPRIHPGRRHVCDAVRARGVRMALGAADRNCRLLRKHADQTLQALWFPRTGAPGWKLLCPEGFDGTVARAVRRAGYRQEGSEGVRAHAQSDG